MVLLLTLKTLPLLPCTIRQCAAMIAFGVCGNYSVKSDKLSLKFNTYTQHGMCKSLTKSYNKTQMKFVFLVESVGKDTLVLKRQSK